MKSILKNLTKILTVAVAIGTFSACNSTEEVATTLPSSATVRNFSLEANDSILSNLDSVFFSIDLYTLEIFNADSLPYGTNVSALTPVITTESASVVELISTNAEGEEETLNYLENTSTAIDFTTPVRLHVVSYDGSTERDYTIRVNVHAVPVDTLVWSRTANTSLPTAFSAINAQHTAMSSSGTYYCMTMYQDEYSIAVTDNPTGQWQTAKINPGFTPDINSLTATNDRLYILDKNGMMYTSADNGTTWEETGVEADNIVGAYGNSLIGTRRDSSTWNIFQYPSGTTIPAPANFPVTNTSNAISITFEMATNPQLIFTGGRKADGNISSDTWAFDGTNWVKVTRREISKQLENMTIVPYFELEPDTISWKVSPRKTVLLAMCGNDATGTPNSTVFMSPDFGMTWNVAPSNMQLPENTVPARTHAQAYPYTGIKSLDSRASHPITEWDVPYILLFGGENAQGITYNTMFRGVITAFTMKPLQ